MTMRWLHTTAGLMLAVLVLLAAMACGGSSKKSSTPTFNENPTPIPIATEPAFPVTIQRSDGKALTLAKPPEHIVSMSPAATEIIYALGAEKSLIAVDKQSNFPDAANSFATKVDAFEPNVEQIAGLKPDLVIMLATDNSGIVPKLDALNIPVLYENIDTAVKTLEDVWGQIRIIGEVTGTNDKAVPLISGLEGRVKKVQDAVQGLNQTLTPKVYHELDSTFFTASNNTFIGDLYHVLRAQNIAGNGGGQAYPQMTQEAIIAANPKVIILADEEFGVSIDSVKARPGWSAIDAVQNGNIFAIKADIISRPGPRIVDALEQLAKDIYPQRFQ